MTPARISRARVLQARRVTLHYAKVLRWVSAHPRVGTARNIRLAQANFCAASAAEARAADFPQARDARPLGFGARRTWRGEYRR
jgi:hypothetical protein